MDMVKQTLAALVGSIALSGCLTDPTLVDVPQTSQADAAEDGTVATDGDPIVWALSNEATCAWAALEDRRFVARKA
ncbi:MAG: hypothetical protein ACE5GE_08565 [Phycisphaerae bacterium]